ncbi:hypothetical protein QR680_011073 [Steinernema hermaphroditum]|uniref:Uncharacterized protein n=1 Tax=Steinernema hermaphroditum TaxID=289476 RepID=A0AA39MC78_9BILA|nr:hypothetical protein QR680_011073 [Steinernema hermaphroditum]
MPCTFRTGSADEVYRATVLTWMGFFALPNFGDGPDDHASADDHVSFQIDVARYRENAELLTKSDMVLCRLVAICSRYKSLRCLSLLLDLIADCGMEFIMSIRDHLISIFLFYSDIKGLRMLYTHEHLKEHLNIDDALSGEGLRYVGGGGKTTILGICAFGQLHSDMTALTRLALDLGARMDVSSVESPISIAIRSENYKFLDTCAKRNMKEFINAMKIVCADRRFEDVRAKSNSDIHRMKQIRVLSLAQELRWRLKVNEDIAKHIVSNAMHICSLEERARFTSLIWELGLCEEKKFIIDNWKRSFRSEKYLSCLDAYFPKEQMDTYLSWFEAWIPKEQKNIVTSLYDRLLAAFKNITTTRKPSVVPSVFSREAKLNHRRSLIKDKETGKMSKSQIVQHKALLPGDGLSAAMNSVLSHKMLYVGRYKASSGVVYDHCVIHKNPDEDKQMKNALGTCKGIVSLQPIDEIDYHLWSISQSINEDNKASIDAIFIAVGELGNSDYSLLNANCEHLVSRSQKGKAHSAQVHNLFILWRLANRISRFFHTSHNVSSIS